MDDEDTSIRWPTAHWRVVKEYTDGNTTPVDVELQCSAGHGNPGSGTTIASLNWEQFTGVTDCSVVETSLASNYYEFSRSAECDVTDIQDGANYICTIINAPTRTRGGDLRRSNFMILQSLVNNGLSRRLQIGLRFSF